MNPEDVILIFGCHKGKKLSQVPHDYLKWMERTIADKPELIDSVRKVLAANKPAEPFDPKDLAKNLDEVKRQSQAAANRPRFTLTATNVDHVLSLGESLPKEIYIQAFTKEEMEQILFKCEEYTGCMVKTRWAEQGRTLLDNASATYNIKWHKVRAARLANRSPVIDIYIYEMSQTVLDPEEEDRLQCLEALNALAREQYPVGE